MSAMTTAAAGPWVRVDSGERPEDQEEAMFTNGHGAHTATYYAEDDTVRDNSMIWDPITIFKWWARILPPVEVEP